MKKLEIARYSKVIVYYLTIENYSYEGRDYQPYLATTLPSSGRDSNMGDCGTNP